MKFEAKSSKTVKKLHSARNTLAHPVYSIHRHLYSSITIRSLFCSVYSCKISINRQTTIDKFKVIDFWHGVTSEFSRPNWITNKTAFWVSITLISKRRRSLSVEISEKKAKTTEKNATAMIHNEMKHFRRQNNDCNFTLCFLRILSFTTMFAHRFASNCSV